MLIDDLKARKAAIYNQIKIVGSIGVLLLAKEQHLIEAVKLYLLLIKQSDVHLSHELFLHALSLANEL
ncbi:MAG: DUF3368 domain-containing protein [Thiolinea sp.]